MPDVHAKLSASGASRWLACPGSCRMEEGLPDDTSSAALEGTCAHRLAELLLKHETGALTDPAFEEEMQAFRENADYYSEEMVQAITVYVAYAMEALNEARKDAPDAELFSELQVDFSDYVPEGFGTTDVAIVSDDTLRIIDLKYGKGIRVDAEQNPQLRLYALGTLAEFDDLYDIRRVRMTIMQPRIDHISTDEMAVEDLKDWGMRKVRPIAEKALSGTGELIPGEVQCRWCRARGICRARAKKNLELMRFDYAPPQRLTPEEVAGILGCLDELTSWASDVKSYALKEALHGKRYEGWKVVRGSANRKITDPDTLAKRLRKKGFRVSEIYEKKLLTIGKLEKLVGKERFTELSKGCVVKPEGKPALVPLSDKREEIGVANDYISHQKVSDTEKKGN